MKKGVSYAGIGIMLAGAAFFAYKAHAQGKTREEDDKETEDAKSPGPPMPASPEAAKASPAFNNSIQASSPSVKKAIENEARKEGAPPPFVSSEETGTLSKALKSVNWFG